jgi:hypothetical protein
MKKLTEEEIDMLAVDLKTLANKLLADGLQMQVTDKDIRIEFHTLLQKLGMN